MVGIQSKANVSQVLRPCFDITYYIQAGNCVIYCYCHFSKWLVTRDAEGDHSLFTTS